MSEKKFVTYEEFGAVGDGVTNDFPAIKATHDFANENGLTVKAESGKTYYISDTRINGVVEAAIIKTDVIWTGASFIIDDSPYSTHEHFGIYDKNVFEVLSDYPMEKVVDEALFEKILANGLNKATKKIDMGLGYPALIVPYNSKHKVYRRKGYGQWMGASMHEVILLDKDGNISEETPVMWDYNGIDYINVIRADVKPITIEGGKFTTVACNTNCVVYDESGKPIGVNEAYIKRGIRINRSYTTLRGVEHYITGELSVTRQKKGETGAPYSGFYASQVATNITIENCVMTGRRCYQKAWIGPGFGGTMGTYGLTAYDVNKIVFKNCVQSNFWVTLDENDVLHPAKEGDKGAMLALSQMKNDKGQMSRMHWGVGGTNFCKNMEYIGCTLSRFDAHQGLCNGKVIDSTVVAMALTGCGNMYIENVRVFAESHSRAANRMFSMREDYGSTWEGNIYVKNLKAYVYTKRSTLQNAVPNEYEGIFGVSHNYRNWYYGYDCHFPNISFDSVEVYDIETFEPVPEGTAIYFTTNNILNEPAMHCENTLKIHPIYPGVDNDGDGLVDGTNIPFSGEISKGGIVDESSHKNLNPIVPPEYIKITNNKNNYAYIFDDTSEIPGADGGFFGKTKFITEDESFVGTANSGSKNGTFKFITHKGE